MRNKLAELLEEASGLINNDLPTVEQMADYLIEHGVIVPPVKVGQTVWCVLNRTKPQKFQITIVTMSEKHYSFVIEAHKGVYKHYCDQDSVGRVVFFTEQEAEKALAERSNR